MTSSYPAVDYNTRIFTELFSTQGLRLSDQQAEELLQDPNASALVLRIMDMMNNPESINVVPSEKAREKLRDCANELQMTKSEFYEFIGQMEIIVALDNRTVVEAEDVENLYKVWEWQREQKASIFCSTAIQ